MKLLEDIVRKIILNETVSDDEVNDALDNHKRVIIKYDGPAYKKGKKGEEEIFHSGPRVIEVYAFGQTSLGNKVIRAFEPYGSTQSKVPEWKYFRLDRITDWKPTEQIFTRPADFYYKNLGKFNPDDDKTMAIVYKIAKFGDEQTTSTNTKAPKTKEDVYKSSSEYNMERFKQNADNPITLSDIELQGNLPQPKVPQPKTNDDVYKTYNKKGEEQDTQEKSSDEKQKELDKLRQILKDKTVTLSDLNKQMNDEVPEEPKWKQVFDDNAENDLRQMQRRNNVNMNRRDNRWEKSSDTRPLYRKGALQDI